MDTQRQLARRLGWTADPQPDKWCVWIMRRRDDTDSGGLLWFKTSNNSLEGCAIPEKKLLELSTNRGVDIITLPGIANAGKIQVVEMW